MCACVLLMRVWRAAEAVTRLQAQLAVTFAGSPVGHGYLRTSRCRAACNYAYIYIYVGRTYIYIYSVYLIYVRMLPLAATTCIDSK